MPRDLDQRESTLLSWLIANPTCEAVAYSKSEIEDLRVISQPPYECASVDFVIPSEAEMTIVSDYYWKTTDGHLCGVYLFLRGNELGGIDVWSIDGNTLPIELPDPRILKPLSEILSR